MIMTIILNFTYIATWYDYDDNDYFIMILFFKFITQQYHNVTVSDVLCATCTPGTQHNSSLISYHVVTLDDDTTS